MNKELIKVCCQTCINSYGGEHGKEKKVLENIIYFHYEHVEAHIGTYEYKTILCFRGSDGWQDWFDNFKFWKTKTPKEWFGKSYKLHSGFVEQVKIIYNEVMNLTKHLEEIVITGHSLGGALATIFAGILTKKGVKVILIIFGSPRVGTPLFTKWINKNVFYSLRYKNGEDTVTKVPPSWMGYQHIKKKKKLGKTSWREILLWPLRKIFGNPFDHEPEDYLKSL